MKKILVPVDGVETNPKMIKMAKEMAEKFNSKIIVVYVKDYINYSAGMRFTYTTYYPEMQASEDENAKEVIRTVKNQFDHMKDQVEGVILSGDPANEILDYSERENVDLIIMATHGMNVTKRFLLGSVTSKVVHHSNVSVLVVR